MSEIRPLADSNSGSELNRNNDSNGNSSGDELFGNPAFINVLEAVVLRIFPQLCTPIFVPLVQRIVREELDLAHQRFSTRTNQNSGERTISSQQKNLKLEFQSTLALPILTGNSILGQNNTPIKIDLVDENTGLVVKHGPEASARVEVVVLRADPNDDEGHEWTSEKFVQNIMEGSGKNKSLLRGITFLKLNQGTCSAVDRMYFPNVSKWTTRCHLKLGARFVNKYDGINVKEATSESFLLGDRRNTLYKKNPIPKLTDDVWHLPNIGRKGIYKERLKKENINKVGDFLAQYYSDPKNLQDILQMKDKMFAETVEHSRTCERGNPNEGVVCHDAGLLMENDFVSVDKLPEKSKGKAQISIASATKNWGDVVSYDESSLPSSSTYSGFPNYPSLYSPSPEIYYAPHTEPSTSSPPPTILYTAYPQTSVVYDQTQPCVSSLSSIVDESYFDYVFNEIQPDISPSMDHMGGLGWPYDVEADDMEFLREILHSPIHDLHPKGQGFDDDDDDTFDYTSVVEDFNNQAQSTWIRKVLKMVLVVRFLHRMRTEKTDHIRKRMRVY